MKAIKIELNHAAQFMTNFLRALATASFIITAAMGSAYAADRDTLYQYSTIDGLLAGLYDGEMTVGEIAAHGDFGLGTFNDLDGEMIVIDGIVYQARGGGTTQTAPAQTLVPFVSVTFFDANKTAPLPSGFNLAALEAYLDQLAPNQNVYQAIRVDGVFKHLKLRTPPKQSKPYAPLAQVIAQQDVFELKDVAGTLVGIRTPQYLASLNVAGYHFHFITADRATGGHVFEITADSGTIRIDRTAQFKVTLPETQKFAALDLNQSRHEDMKRVEQVRSQPSQLKAMPTSDVMNPVVASPALPLVAPVVAPPPVLTLAAPNIDTTNDTKKSKAPWAFLFECKDEALPDHMRMRNQRHKAARRPANKSSRCP